MPDILTLNYKQTGKSKSNNELGMREMQSRAYEARDSQYLLLKSPPASGKSRALMFLALDKLHHQNISKVIVAVPERTIGASFANTDLVSHGFFTDWNPSDEYNLCTSGGDKSKVKAFKRFMSGSERILICTHATLRFAFDELTPRDFNNTLLAIDEFHHVSASGDNKLGEVLRSIIAESTAHIVAMTGSYFRGDSVPVLLPEHEAQFTRVTYNYYEQLNGYEYLKTLGLGYHFYQGKYTETIEDILDTTKKTILHIPSVNASESTKDKYAEVDFILDAIGDYVGTDEATGITKIRCKKTDRIIKVADLVQEDGRERVTDYLRKISQPADLDLIIALGMAKEGFDWKYCEQALTVGYRGSLTEVIQIIGRCTRDSSNKTHAQFTNLIAQPEASDDQVAIAVNNMLKAITCSLLMEQVMAPNCNLKPKKSDDDKANPGEIKIRGLKKPSTQRVKDIVEQDLNDLKAAILQDDKLVKALPGNVDPEVINKVFIPKIIEVKYPELNADEVEEVRQYVVADTAIKSAEVKEAGDKKFIQMADKFINIDELHIDLIDKINPFQRAFEILSKSVDAPTLQAIQSAIEATRIKMTSDEALILWPKIKAFVQKRGRQPEMASKDPLERRMAEALVYIKVQRKTQGA